MTFRVAPTLGPSSNVSATSARLVGPWTVPPPNHDASGVSAPTYPANTRVATTRTVPYVTAGARFGVSVGRRPKTVALVAATTATATTTSNSHWPAVKNSTISTATDAMIATATSDDGATDHRSTMAPNATVKRNTRIAAAATSSRWGTSHSTVRATAPPTPASVRFLGRTCAPSAPRAAAATSTRRLRTARFF